MGVKKELEERGWTKGMLVNADGNVCLMGALHCAIWGNPKPAETILYPWDKDEHSKKYRLREKAIIFLGEQIGQCYEIAEWNDEKATFQEVLDVAEKLDAEMGWLV